MKPLRPKSSLSATHHSVTWTKTNKSTAGALLVAMAIALVAFLSSNQIQDAPILPYQFFVSPEDRTLSTGGTPLQRNSAPYNNEKPLGAGGHKTVMLLGIFSTSGSKYAGRRAYIRDTYLALGDKRMCKLSEYKRQVAENPNNVVCQVPYTFVIAGGSSDRPYDHDDDEPLTIETDNKGEADPEGDCTYLNIRENMEDGKSSTYFKFGASLKNFDIDYIAKIDDDSVLAPQLLIQFVEDDLPPTPYNRRHYGGSSWASYAHNIMYGAGQFYFMSTDLAYYVGFQLSAKQRKFLKHKRPTEDADMGRFIFSHPRPVKFVNLSHNKFWHHPKKTEEKFRETWDKHMLGLPIHGHLLPFWHLCPNWLKGKGV